MPYVYLVGSVLCVASASILGGFYNRKNEGTKNSSALYTLLTMCSVFAFWIILFAFEPKADVNVLPYSLLFAGCYAICNIAMINALKTGPIVLTSLILQLSLIGVTVWGFFFWNVQFSVFVGIGLGLVVASLWLCLYTGKKEDGGKINLQWILYVLLMFAGNAGCTIVQKTQQMQFDGKYGNFLMLVATGISVMVCLIGYLRNDKSDSRNVLKTSWYLPVSAGICNALLNLFVMFLATSSLSPSLIYPVLAVGGLIVTTAFSAFVFKEKMRWWQWVGVAIGVVATGILNGV